MKLQELTGVFNRERWRPINADETGDTFVIADLQDGTGVKGKAPQGELIPGLTYRFFGTWDDPHPKYGKSFKFTQFTKCEPHSRFGLVNYLKRFAPNVGPAIATRLFDQYQSDACKILRTDPSRVAREIRGLTLERAKEAAAALAELAKLEDVKIELTNLFAGRGFPGVLTDQVIRKWGPLAPQRIRRDPFSLLVHGFTGCGFARCDRLYLDLGLPPTRLKRQMICLWHALKSDNDGHTWFPVSVVEQKLREHVSGARVNLRKAVTLGIRSGWLEIKVDAAGCRWVAHGEKARNERTVAECVLRLLKGPEVLPRFTEAVEGECDESDAGSPWAGCPQCHGRGYTEIYVELEGPTDICCPLCNSSEEKRYRDKVNGTGEREKEEIDIPAMLELGRRVGVCQRCGRKLVHLNSLAAGVGPYCAEQWNVPWGETVANPQEAVLA